eukprot:2790817-Amphidinium_carterae.1
MNQKELLAFIESLRRDGNEARDLQLPSSLQHHYVSLYFYNDMTTFPKNTEQLLQQDFCFVVIRTTKTSLIKMLNIGLHPTSTFQDSGA